MSKPENSSYVGRVDRQAILDRAETLLNEHAEGRASALRMDDGKLRLMLDIGGLSDSAGEALADDLRDRLSGLPDVSRVDIAMTRSRAARRLIAVGSGKGGVGKSTLSANLAVALAQAGRSVGLVDADIYGPSQPRLMGCEGVKPDASEANKLIPVRGAGDVPFLSLGQLVEPGQPVAWRGPMAGNALSQLIDGEWGGTEEIVVDLPPGTGDIQLSMIQKHKPAGAVIVSTPQDLSLIDATRAIAFFDKAGVPIIGIVENMAGYICPHCGEASDPFGHGGAEAEADRLGIPFLGRIPLTLDIRIASDAGKPPALSGGPEGAAFAKLAGQVADWLDKAGET